MRYVIALLSSAFLAVMVASVALLASPSVSEAASEGGYVKTCTGGRIYLKADEKRTLYRHNEVRRSRDLRPFCVDSRLTRAAREHSRDMIERDYFSHYTKGKGWDPGKRLDREGYDWRTYGENIGSNSAPDRMFRAWMDSSGHRRNILDKGFREIGIGTDTGNFQGQRTTMYTVDFATRR